MAVLDTHKTVKKFIALGFTEDQAEGITDAIKEQNDSVATKGDLKMIKTEIGALRSEMNTEIGSLRSEMNTEIGSLRSEMNTLKWMVGLVCALMILMISLTLTAK